MDKHLYDLKVRLASAYNGVLFNAKCYTEETNPALKTLYAKEIAESRKLYERTRKRLAKRAEAHLALNEPFFKLLRNPPDNASARMIQHLLGLEILAEERPLSEKPAVGSTVAYEIRPDFHIAVMVLSYDGDTVRVKENYHTPDVLCVSLDRLFAVPVV